MGESFFLFLEVDFPPGNFNLGGGGGLRCCWWGEVKLIQNSSFLFHSHYSPMFPEKKVGKNTFRAFTGKLEEPIDWRSGGGDASLEGWRVLTSWGHERSAGRRLRYQPSEELQAVAGKLRRKIPFCFCCWQKCLMSCFVWETWWERMIARCVCLHKDLQKVSIYPPSPPPIAALSAIDVSLVSGMKQNSSQLCSTIVCWLLWHNDLHFARHFGRD